MTTQTRSLVSGIEWNKVLLYTGLILVAFIAMTTPAFAAFTQLENTMTKQTCGAFKTGRTILYVAAVVALLVGVAPMLWGQVKVKWLVSCLVATVLFAIIPTVITAFAGTNVASCPTT